MNILRGQHDRKVLSLEQVFTSSLPPFSVVKGLYIYRPAVTYLREPRHGNIANMLRMELLHPFTTAVMNLYLCKEIASHIVPAVLDLVGGKPDTSVAHPAKSFPGGAFAVENYRGRYWIVCCQSTDNR
jgi:hypothetical protein